MSAAASNALDEVRARAADDAAAAAAAARAESGAATRLALALEVERARWFYWVPVLVGAGIAAYFALPVEPPLAVTLLPLALALVARLALPRTTLLDMATAAFVLAAFGFALIAVRTTLVAAPVLEGRLTNVDVRGLVERIEPRIDKGERITLLATAIGNLAADQLPHRVRVSTTQAGTGLVPGDTVRLRATLAPPGAPALPGDYDFARHAYYQGIGAVGFATSPPQRDPDGLALTRPTTRADSALAPAAQATLQPRASEQTTTQPPLRIRFSALIERLRQRIGERIAAALPGERGGIAAALLTGERGGISEATNDVYRASGLFHILSISGLHMAIMGGAVFWIVRLALALLPLVALRFPIKKWAAVAAIAGAFGYLAISGGSFATVRSFIMIAVMFLAVLLDRPALALRNVALSALVILLIYPESLLDVGFQMSFAAVVALVAAYELVRDRLASDGTGGIGMLFRIGLFFGGIVMTTLVASIAVAPFAAYHFHKSQQFAVLANLLAVPITNLVVMPAALATLVVMPLGLEAAPLAIMGLGIDAMTWTAQAVAALPGAVVSIKAMPAAAFALMLGGGLWLTLWHARWRLLGLAPIAAGIALAPFAPRPDLLVGRDGRLIGVRGGDGQLVLVAPPQSRFEIERWLENDGDARTFEAALQASARALGGPIAGARGAAAVAARPVKLDRAASERAASAAARVGADSAATVSPTVSAASAASASPPASATTSSSAAHSSSAVSAAAAVAGAATVVADTERPYRDADADRRLVCDAVGCTTTVKGVRIAMPLHAAAFADDCVLADIVVSAATAPRGCSRPALVVDRSAARALGTHAVYIESPRRIRIETVAGHRGVRPWSPLRNEGPRAKFTRTRAPSGAPTGRDADRPHARQHQTSRVGDFASPPLADALHPPRPDVEDAAAPHLD